MELYWPATLYPSASEVTVKDGSGRFVSPFTGTTRTVSRPGATRLQLSMSFTGLQGAKRGALKSLVAGLGGAEGRVWIRDFSYTQRGSFPTGELLGNVAFDATTGWTASNAEVSLYANGGKFRITRTAATAHSFVYYTQITGLTSGAAYAARALMETGKGSEAWALRVGATATGNEYIGTSIQNSPGLVYRGATIAATSAYFCLLDYYQDSTASPIVTRAAGNFQTFTGVSFSRCFLINGASQTGTGLVVDKLPTSTNGLLLPGDQVQIGDQLNFVTEPLNSDSSGNGYLRLALPVRESPADNDPVIVYQPAGKFLLAEQENSWQNALADYAAAELRFVEAVD